MKKKILFMIPSTFFGFVILNQYFHPSYLFMAHLMAFSVYLHVELMMTKKTNTRLSKIVDHIEKCKEKKP
jgi:hypothetical protein